MPDEASGLLEDESTRAQNYQGTANGAVLPESNEAGVPQKPAEAARTFRDYLVIVAPLTIGVLLAAMDATIVVSAYASIGSDLNALQNTSWIATAYMLTLTSFQPIYGKLSDIFGRKACLLMAYCIFGLGTLFCGLSRNMTQLIAARGFTGLGGGGMSTVVSIIVSDYVPLRTRGTWQGILNIVFATGMSAGAPLGGLFADSIGWRWAFLFQFPLVVLAILSVSLALRNTVVPSSESLKTKVKRIDFLGATVLVTAIFCLLLSLEQLGNSSLISSRVLLLFGFSFVLIAIFLVVESKIASDPFAPLRLITDTSLIACYLCNFFSFSGTVSTIFNVSLYFQAVKKLSAAQAGVGLLPGIFGGVSGSLFGGIMMQKTGKYYLMTVAGYACMVLGNVGVNLITQKFTYSFPFMYTSLLLLNFGSGIGVTTTLVGLIAYVSPKDQAVVTAMSYLFRSLGSVIGISIGSALVQSILRSTLHRQLQTGDVDEIVRRVRESLDNVEKLDPATRVIVREAYERSIHMAFRFGAVMAFCSLVSSLFIREKSLNRS